MSDKVVKLIEDVKALTVLELSELVKALEEEFGVSAAAPVAVAAAPAAGAAVGRRQLRDGHRPGTCHRLFRNVLCNPGYERRRHACRHGNAGKPHLGCGNQGRKLQAALHAAKPRQPVLGQGRARAG